jgi:hypothetical protein
LSARSARADANRATTGLREEQIWPLVYPGFSGKGTLAQDARACNGRAPLTAEGLGGGTPATIDEGAIALGGGGDRLKVGWIRSLTYGDGTVGGTLALLRSASGVAEV